MARFRQYFQKLSKNLLGSQKIPEFPKLLWTLYISTNEWTIKNLKLLILDIPCDFWLEFKVSFPIGSQTYKLTVLSVCATASSCLPSPSRSANVSALQLVARCWEYTGSRSLKQLPKCLLTCTKQVSSVTHFTKSFHFLDWLEITYCFIVKFWPLFWLWVVMPHQSETD